MEILEVLFNSVGIRILSDIVFIILALLVYKLIHIFDEKE